MMNELASDYSPRTSMITTSTSNSLPLTPTSTIELPSYATTLSGRNEEPVFPSAASYFELRPPSAQLRGNLISHHIIIGPRANIFTIPFPQPEELWLERDVQFQDWMTFMNFMIPHPTTVKSMIPCSSPEENNGHGDKNVDRGVGERVIIRELEDIPPFSRNDGGDIYVSQHSNDMRNMRIDAVIAEWNHDFFLLRNLEIVRRFESPNLEECSSHTAGDAHAATASVYQNLERHGQGENECAVNRLGHNLCSPVRGVNSNNSDSSRSGTYETNPRLERRLTKAAAKGLEKVLKWDQALMETMMEKIKEGEPAFHPSTSCKDKLFYNAVVRSNNSMVKYFMKNGADVNVRDVNGVPAIYRAVSRGDSAMVKILLESPVDVNACTPAGDTPIYRAVSRGDSAIVKMLLEKPINTNVKTASGDTPIYRAASRRDSAVVKLLLTRSPDIDVNQRAENGKTALYRSVSRGDYAVTKMLLDSGADIGQEVDGDLPLSKAASRRDTSMMKLLAKKQDERGFARHGSI